MMQHVPYKPVNSGWFHHGSGEDPRGDGSPLLNAVEKQQFKGVAAMGELGVYGLLVTFSESNMAVGNPLQMEV